MTAPGFCANHRCTHEVKHPRLVCKLCWVALPKELRTRISRYLMAGHRESARIALHDWYCGGRA